MIHQNKLQYLKIHQDNKKQKYEVSYSESINILVADQISQSERIIRKIAIRKIV